MLRASHMLLSHIAIWMISIGILCGQARIDTLPRIGWHKIIGTHIYNSSNHDLESRGDGSIYYSGSYSDALYIGTQTIADTTIQDTAADGPFNSHAFIARLDTAGEFLMLWTVGGDSGSSSTITDITFDESENIVALGYFSGRVHFPSGETFETQTLYQPNGFLARLTPSGALLQLTRISSAGVVLTGSVYPEENGELGVVLAASQFPITVFQDTIIGDSMKAFMSVIKVDSNGMVLNWGAFSEEAQSEGGYSQSTIDSSGNFIMEFYVQGLTPWDSGTVAYRGTTLNAKGYHLAKLDRDLEIDWIHRTNSQPSGWAHVLKTDAQDAIYFSSDDATSSNAFLEKYNSRGELQWSLKSSGETVKSQDIGILNDFIVWIGYYECEMILDTIHFNIGEAGPCTWPARDGFICLVNKQNGEVAWVMSEADRLESKYFSKLVLPQGGGIFVAAQIFSQNCTIDTLSLLNIAPSATPYTLLFQLQGLPPLPESPDTIYLPNLARDFDIWPNPTLGEVRIRTTGSWSTDLVVEVFNAMGQLLCRQALESNQPIIHLEGLSSGVVYVKLRDNLHGFGLTKPLGVLK